MIDTKPANAPFNVIDKSALPNIKRAVNKAATTPPAAAALVLTNTSDTAFASPTLDTINSEPPLNPNQPSQRMNVPSVAKGILHPGIATTRPSSV